MSEGKFISIVIVGILLFVGVLVGTITFIDQNSRLSGGVYEGQYTEIVEGLEVLQGADRDRIVNRAIEWNADIRTTQYWASFPVVGLFYPDEVMELRTIPIR